MAMELEGRRSSDNNWYHCQVSICSNGRQNVLKVHFSEEDEEYIFTPDEARSRLRPVSKCPEKGECKMLQVGDMVLVPSYRMEHGKFGFFEAEIREIYRHQHSSVETCNCKLEVMRVGAMNEESKRVPTSQVRLVDLSSSIQDNPIFCDWICSRTTKGTHWLDTSDAESDMHTQLDEQINKITMMTNSFNETSSSTTQFLTDAATKTPRTRRNMRSQSSSFLKNGRRQRKASSNNTSKSGLSLDKPRRLSPLAARAALAATVLTKPLRQVKPPSLLESKVMRSYTSKYRPDMRAVIVAKNDSRKCRKDCRKDLKAKKKKNRVKERGKRNAISGPCYTSYLMKSTHLPENVCVELSVDIPLYESSFPETSIDLIIDLPIFKS